MSRKKTRSEFIKDAKKIHGDKYNYKKVKYVSNKIPVEIICGIHGSFIQKPNTHLNKKDKHGCPYCGREQQILKIYKRVLTKKDFIKRAKKLFPSYDYSKIKSPKNNKEKVTIICPIHGFFQKSFNAFLEGHGCPRCGKQRGKKCLTLTQKEFEKKASKIHKNRYSYSLSEYKKSSLSVEIKCPIHGSFKQTARNHLRGAGCKKCALKEIGKKKSKLVEKNLINDFKETHGERYDYSKVKYTKSNLKIQIICKKHGPFWQKSIVHKKGSGCPVCRQSKGEAFIAKYLDTRLS